MNSELLATLEYIEQDRGINKEQLVETIEKAVFSTISNKRTNTLPESAFVKLDLKSGAMRVWAKLFPNYYDPPCTPVPVLTATAVTASADGEEESDA